MHPDRRFDLIAGGLMAIPLAFGLARWADLPAQMAIHWSGGGPDTFVSKPVAILGLFLFGLGTVAFVRIAPSSMTNTPGGQNVTVLFLGLVFAWVHGMVVVWNLGYHFSITLAVLPILLLAGALVAYAMWGGSMG
ncbi:MAG: DUF1648 domain-containing protein [Halodesulfurarchaeum sp.]